MSQLRTGFNLQPGAPQLPTPFSLTSLVGRNYWTVVGSGPSAAITLRTVALPISMSSFFNAFFLVPTPTPLIAVTSSPPPLPANRPIPTGFILMIAGGGGGGGGGGGTFNDGVTIRSGGSGGGGGGAATITTPFFPYNAVLFSGIAINFPAGGGGGSGGYGGGNTIDGNDGTAGVSAVFAYNGTLYTAGGGGAGSRGYRGQFFGDGSNGTAGGGGIATCAPSPPGGTSLTNGIAGSGTSGGSIGGGNGGPANTNGAAGGAGFINIYWFFT
jgi:hypothetical protein